MVRLPQSLDSTLNCSVEVIYVVNVLTIFAAFKGW